MRRATNQAIAFALKQHEAVNHIVEPEPLAKAWGVIIIPGKANRATNGPPSVITLKRDTYAPRQRFTMHHELGHIMIQRAGLEEAIKGEVDAEDAQDHLEMVASYIGSLLVMPDPLVRRAFDRYGVTPQTVLDLQSSARVSFAAASRRIALAHTDEPTTIFLSGATTVLDVASTHPRSSLRPYSRLPDPRASFPHAALLTLSDHIRPRTIGVIVGWREEEA
ncbi:ImmA/IrrE family metallo-endopeptidase [Deinococcus sp. QL22]|uniref:ImmA/IrrE family metallo-endopeptidase n=1 Tax=Deinococcus sp. QL22 TaxID=2939437 RepID=UPI0020176E5E|nr:ImmA/IrrE family metallo-endopeptidase [Deinococcus sp. QL22]UQN06327.1 ImmA/IrrE family metallo-endopeptidase [Deinococcus sp. QL22]